MAERTRIEWTEATWNPVVGCTRVRLVPEVLDQPLRWRRSRMIFVNSMSDLFHEDVPFEFIAAVFGVMATAQHHTFQILTKRPKRMLSFFETIDEVAARGFGTRWERLAHCFSAALRYGVTGLPTDVHANGADWPLANVWLGVSVETQEAADERIPLLLQAPAAVRFVSCEPLLGPIDLTCIDVPSAGPGSSLPAAPPSWVRYNALTGEVTHFDHKLYGVTTRRYKPLDWVIVGDESGPGRRHCDLEWVRSIRDQCVAVGVPFLLKQLHFGGQSVSLPELDGRRWIQWPGTVTDCVV